MTIYTDILALNVPISNHESDLYVKATPEVLDVVKKSKHTWSYFTNEISKDLWIDIPFAFEPWWEKRLGK